MERIRQEIAPTFFLWMDGSFVENKLNPADIDVVVFMDFQLLETHRAILKKPFFTTMAKFDLGIDLHFEPFYPANHRKQFITHLQKLYWEDVFGSTRRDESGMRFAKGFIRLNFNYND